MMTPSSGYLWVTPDRQTAWLWKPLAMHLARRTGLVPVMVVASEEDRRFYAKQGEVDLGGEIVVRDDYYAAVAEGRFADVDRQDVLARAEAYERAHGVSLMRSMILADRHLGRGFIPGGAGYPRSRISENGGHVPALAACLEAIGFWERLARSHPPGLVLSYGGGGGLAGKPYALLCRQLGIPLRILFPFRFGDLFFWGRDEFSSFPELEARFASAADPEPTDVEAVARQVLPSGLATNPVHRNRIARNLRWTTIARMLARIPVQRAYWALRGYRKGRIGARPLAQARNLVNARLNWNWLCRHALRDLSRLDGRQIVYFTLQQEPESSTLVMAPFATNQVAQLRELALSLPAGATLVVKEHIWALYGRPEGFYESIREIPNVVLVHPAASSLEIIRRADLVCVITSSAGYEAAVMGKPVIHLGHASTLFALPHVAHVRGPGDFERVRDILSAATAPGAAERRARDGARYFIAAREACIDLAPLAIHGRTTPLADEECRLFADPLLGSLAGAGDQDPTAAKQGAMAS